MQDTQYKTGQQNRLTINLSKLDKKHLESLKDFMKAEIINNSVKFGLERKWQKLNQLKNQKSCTTDIE